jgi:hypothetical protein
VTQNLPVLSFQELNPPNTFQSVFNLAQGPPAPVFVQVPSSGQFALPNGVSGRALPTQQHLSRVDAFNVTLQRELTPTISGEIAYVGNRGDGFIGDNPAANVNQASIVGFGTLSQDQRKPFFNCGVTTADGLCGRYGWSQGIDYFSNTGQSSYNALQAKLTKRFSNGISVLTHYTLQTHKNNDGDYFFIDPNVNYGPPTSSASTCTCWRGRRTCPSARARDQPQRRRGPLPRGWQINANVTIMSGLPFNVSYRDAGADRDTGPSRPNLIGDAQTGSGDGLTSPYFNVIPIGTSGSAFGRPARGTFGDLDRNALRGPGFWNVDASLFKRFRIRGNSNLEFRIEAQNVFNHVNLDNPDAEVGVPGNNNTHAGFISGTAPNWNPRQRAVRAAVPVLTTRP